jgi:hypothetical protein
MTFEFDVSLLAVEILRPDSAVLNRLLAVARKAPN